MSKVVFAVAFLGIAVFAAIIVILLNITIFCQNQHQLNFGLFKVNCNNAFPDKAAELDAALNRSCYVLRTSYGCDARSMEKVSSTYSEFGKAPRNYTLLELCHLKNSYFTDQQCTNLCGCG